MKWPFPRGDPSGSSSDEPEVFAIFLGFLQLFERARGLQLISGWLKQRSASAADVGKPPSTTLTNPDRRFTVEKVTLSQEIV